MERRLSKVASKFAVIAAITIIVAISTVISNSALVDMQGGTKSNITPLTNPRTQDITESDNSTGLGQSLTAIEFAQSVNNSQSIAAFNNDSCGLGFIGLPPQWTGYELFAGVSGLSDNKTWEVNGTMNSQYAWTYIEDDHENHGNTGLDPDENCWGWYDATPPSGTDSGAIFMHTGYFPWDPYPTVVWDPLGDGSEYSAFTQTFSVDRKNIQGMRFAFDYWVNTSAYGVAQLYIKINSYIRNYPAFEMGSITGTWLHEEFVLTPAEITTYFSTLPGTVTIEVGIDQTMTTFQITPTDGYVYQEVYFDNISLWMRGLAKPSQLQLRLNETQTVTDWDYGRGNRTLKGTWANPSETDFTSLIANFTSINASRIQLTTNMTLYVNRTKLSQTNENTEGTVFWVSNNSNVNWTAYYYAYSPFLYTNYNFSIRFPSDWNIWVVYDPTPTEILSQLTVSSGKLDVDATKANRPGLWRIEFNSPNYVTRLKTYVNGSIGPSNWEEKSVFWAGDWINITAQIGSTPFIGTKAQLQFKLPDGSFWQAQSQLKDVQGDGSVSFDAFQIPFMNQTDYIPGNYKVIITWNNSLGAGSFNETGVNITSFMVQHHSSLELDDSQFSGLVEGDKVELYATFQDQVSETAIEGGTLFFTNFTGQTQVMSMIRPGYYFAEILIQSFIPGEKNITINATHPSFSNSFANVTIQFSLKTQITTPNPAVNVMYGNNFTISVNYTQLNNGNGLTGALENISVEGWIGTYLKSEIGNGNYSIECNTSNCEINTNYVFFVTVQKTDYLSSSQVFNILVTYRSAFIQKVQANGTDITIGKSYHLPITADLNITADLFDSSTSLFLGSATLELIGIDTTPLSFTEEGMTYQCIVNKDVLSEIKTYYATLSAGKLNYTLTTTPLQITVEKIDISVQTKDKATAFAIEHSTPFTIGVYVNNTDFGGTVLGCEVTYLWTQGQGNLTDPDGDGYYTIPFTELPPGTWTFLINVYKGSNYQTVTIDITVSVTAPPELPTEYLYLFIALAVGVGVAVLSYLFYFRFPKVVRQMRALKRSVSKGRTTEFKVKSSQTLLAEAYLGDTKQILPQGAQTAIREKYLKEVESKPEKRGEEASAMNVPEKATPPKPEGGDQK